MNKQEFIASLSERLAGLPREDMERSIEFYSEMIDDLVEEGRTEEEAVSEIGTVDEIVSQIVAEVPLSRLVKEKVKPKRALRVWEIVLLTLGSPIWFSLLIAALAVIFALYVTLWSLVVSVWAVFVSLAASALGGIAASIGLVLSGSAPAGAAMMGAGLVCTGLSIFLFLGCRAATKGTLLLTKKLALGIKNCFVRKEEA